jgi:hypothetical protein
MTTQSKSAVTSVVAALFAVAAFGIHAADEVKSGGPSDRPARALDADSVKAQGASDKAGRALEEDAPVKAPNKKRYSRQADGTSSEGKAVKAPNKKKNARTLEGERSATPRTGRPGNEIDESTVKSQGPSDNPARTADKAGK